MRRILIIASLALVASASLAADKNVTLTWDAPTLRADNVTPLPPGEIQHYTIYSDQCVPGGPFYVMVADRSASLPRTITIANVPPGTCRYRVSATDTLGVEGPMSNITQVTIVAPPPPPGAPLNLTSVVSP
jgi:hypothetical protein